MAKAARRSRTRGRPVRRSRGRPASKSRSRSTSRSRARSSKKKRGKRRSKKVGGDDSDMIFDAQTASYSSITSLIHNNINDNIESATGTGTELTFSNILTNSLSGIKNMLDCNDIFEPGTLTLPPGFNKPADGATVTLEGPNRIVINAGGYIGELEITENTETYTIKLLVSLSEKTGDSQKPLGDIEIISKPIIMDESKYKELIDFLILNYIKNDRPLIDSVGRNKAFHPGGTQLTNPENYIEYNVDSEKKNTNKLFINKNRCDTDDGKEPLIAYSINGEDKFYKINNLNVLKTEFKLSKMTDEQKAAYIAANKPKATNTANNDPV